MDGPEDVIISVSKMATTTAVLGFFLAAVVVGGDAIILAHHTTIEFKCTTNGDRTPDWFVNGEVAVTTGDSYRSMTSNGGGITVTLTIDGNGTQVTWNIHCEVYEEHQFVRVHRATVIFQGFLASPENVSINSSTIEWKLPYSSVNNDTVRVDPHITQYTVYITDNYTGNSIVKENVTETQYISNIQDDGLCPMYQVSAWNAGGEGELSEPIQESTPQVPTAEDITVEVTAESDALNIHIEVDVVCTSRIPEFFLITLMTPTEGILNETTRQHEPGQVFTDFTISLPQNVDVCTIHVRISAGNTAGTSPIETVVVVCSGGNTDSISTTTVSTAAVSTVSTVSTVTTTQSGSNGQPADNTTLIVVLVGIIAVIGGVCIVVATVGILYCRGHKKEKVKNNEIEMKPNQAYETVTRAQSETQVHTKPCPAYEIVAHAYQ